MSNVVGGYSDWSFPVTSDQQQVFDQAIKSIKGVGYTPLACSTQVVAGMNYCFLCEAKVVVPNAPTYPALVYIFKPLQGDPHIHGIKPIKP